jgi:hypothetical protein
MDRVISCPGCGVFGKLPPDYPAGQISCPQCQTVFDVPAAESAAPPVTSVSAQGDGQFAVWVGSPEEKPSIQAVGVGGPSEDDAAAHLDWLRRETHQFNQYVATRLTALDRRRQELASLESRLESEFTTREQELNRLRSSLSARIEALAGREGEFARREAAFAETLAGLDSREAAVAARESKLPTLQLKITELERREKQLWPMVEALERRKADAEHLLERLSELDKRQAELEREGQALARRETELDELEQDIRRELEQREREVEERGRMLELREKQARAAAISQQTPPPVPTPSLSAPHFNDPPDTDG